MRVLGVRCSNKDFAYAVLEGTKAEPSLVDAQAIGYPKGFAKPQSLLWLLQETQSLLSRHNIEKIVLKRFEGKSRDGKFEDRVEHEAAVMLAGAYAGLKPIFRKVKSTIAKDLGQKGRARYLASLDTSWIPSQNMSERMEEAVHAAWTELP